MQDCGTTMASKDHAQHVAEVCALSKLPCERSRQGCQAILERRHIATHDDVCKFHS